MVGKAVGDMISEAVDTVASDKYCDVVCEGAADLDGDTYWRLGKQAWLIASWLVKTIGVIISEAVGSMVGHTYRGHGWRGCCRRDW